MHLGDRSGMALVLLGGEKGTELGMQKIRAGATGAGLVVVFICPC